MMAIGTQFFQVPHKGATAVYPDLLSGRVVFFDSTTGALPFVKSGKIKGLAVYYRPNARKTCLTSHYD